MEEEYSMWCPLLDVSYNWTVGAVLAGLVGHFVIFVALGGWEFIAQFLVERKVSVSGVW